MHAFVAAVRLRTCIGSDTKKSWSR